MLYKKGKQIKEKSKKISVVHSLPYISQKTCNDGLYFICRFNIIYNETFFHELLFHIYSKIFFQKIKTLILILNEDF